MPTIHIVEDDVILRASFAMLIEGEGFESIAYSSSEDFISHYRKKSWNGEDCIVADLHMKGALGIELLRLLKMNGVSSPIIICTGDSSINLMALAFQNGAFDYHIKPFEADDFLNSINHALACQKDWFVESPETKLSRSKLALLSPEEKQILERLRNGESHHVISVKLQIDKKNVGQRIASAMAKMGVTNLSDLVRQSFLTNRVIDKPILDGLAGAPISPDIIEAVDSAFRNL